MPLRLTIRWAAVICVLCLQAAFWPASALSAPEWTSPSSLEEAPAGKYPQVAVAMDARGDTLVVWCQSVGIGEAIFAAWRSAGGTFGAPFEVSPTGDFSFSPTVSMSPDGEAVIAWLSHEAYSYEGQGEVEAVLRSPAGELGQTVKLGNKLGEGTGIAATVGDDGSAMIVWLIHDAGGNSYIEAGSLSSDGNFTEGVLVSPTSPHLTTTMPIIAVNTSGTKAVVWSAAEATADGHPTSSYFTQVAHGSGDDVFSSILDIPIEDGAVAIKANGDLVFAWSRAGVVETATLPAGGEAIETPTILTNLNARSEGVLDTNPVVTADALGEGLITWLSGTQPLAATFGENVGASRAIANPNAVASALVSAMNAQGDSMTMWVGEGGDHEGIPVVEGVARPAGGRFESPRQLVTFGSVIAPLHVALDADGDAASVWMNSSGSHDSVQVAGYQAGGPRLEALQVPAEGRAGTGLPFSVEPLSVWSTVTSTTWSWGDGTADTVGDDVSHTYDKPGVYAISVSAHDALGNVASASRTVTVSEAGAKVPVLEQPSHQRVLRPPARALRSAPQFIPLFGTQVASRGAVLGLLIEMAEVRGADAGDTLVVRCVAGCVRPLTQAVLVGRPRKSRGRLVLKHPLTIRRLTRIEVDLRTPGRVTRFVRYRFARETRGLIAHATRRGCLSATAQAESCPRS
jgi:hypothetical protein